MSFSTIIVIAVAAHRSATAQSLSDMLGRWEASIGLEMVHLDEHAIFNGQEVPGRLHRESAITLTTGVAWAIPIKPLSDRFAVGISPGVSAVVGPVAASPDPIVPSSGSSGLGSGGSGDGLGLAITVVNVPVLATINYGTDAMFERKKNSFGASLGIGYQGSWLFMSTFFYGMPVAAAEIGFYGDRVHKLRASIPIGPYHFSDTFTVAQYNLSYLFTF